MIRTINLIALLCLIATSMSGARKTHNTPAPEGSPLKHDYDVFVQSAGSEDWTRIDTYMAKVDAPIGNGKHKVCETSFARFDFEGTVKVKVVSHLMGKAHGQASVRPNSKGISCTMLNDSTTLFSLDKPEYVSVEWNGDITNNLLLFCDRPVEQMADAKKARSKL